MQSIFEVVIFTASLAIYADPLLDEIDTKRYASYRLFREHCMFYGNTFVKDLSKLGRNLKDTIIVDNSPNSYVFQPENAVPILTWIDDMSDNKLKELAPVLELLSKFEDVRPFIKKIVKYDKCDYIQAEKELRNEFEERKGTALESKDLLFDCWVSPKKPLVKAQQDNSLAFKKNSSGESAPQSPSIIFSFFHI